MRTQSLRASLFQSSLSEQIGMLEWQAPPPLEEDCSREKIQCTRGSYQFRHSVLVGRCSLGTFHAVADEVVKVDGI
eukprot:m.293074 g.293074  ORF g.293074 m.293074 type:complete len:76 (-) comp16239_c0_seq3:657-884(-)